MGEIAVPRRCSSTALCATTQGRKMSKSLGNGIDPLEMIDTLRRGRAALQPHHRQQPRQRHALLRREVRAPCATLPTSSGTPRRFVMMNLTHRQKRAARDARARRTSGCSRSSTRSSNEVTREPRQVRARHRRRRRSTTSSGTCYCDWYIELTKARLDGGDEARRARAQQVLLYVLTEILQAAAPVHAVHHRGDLAGACRTRARRSWSPAGRSIREALAFPAEEARL